MLIGNPMLRPATYAVRSQLKSNTREHTRLSLTYKLLCAVSPKTGPACSLVPGSEESGTILVQPEVHYIPDR